MSRVADLVSEEKSRSNWNTQCLCVLLVMLEIMVPFCPNCIFVLLICARMTLSTVSRQPIHSFIIKSVWALKTLMKGLVIPLAVSGNLNCENVTVWVFFFPYQNISTNMIFVILLLLCNTSIFIPTHVLLDFFFLIIKRWTWYFLLCAISIVCGIFNVCNKCKGETGTDKCAQVLTQGTKNVQGAFSEL